MPLTNKLCDGEMEVVLNNIIEDEPSLCNNDDGLLDCHSNAAEVEFPFHVEARRAHNINNFAAMMNLRRQGNTSSEPLCQQAVNDAEQGSVQDMEVEEPVNQAHFESALWLLNQVASFIECVPEDAYTNSELPEVDLLEGEFKEEWDMENNDLDISPEGNTESINANNQELDAIVETLFPESINSNMQELDAIVQSLRNESRNANMQELDEIAESLSNEGNL